MTPEPNSTDVGNSQPNPTAEPGLRLFLVDDHPIVLKGLIRLTRAHTAWHVCGTASKMEEALTGISINRPDVIILDLTVGGQNGLELVRALRTLSPQTRSLVFSAQDENLYAFRALRAGAAGYLMKQERIESVFRAISQVAGGGLYLSDRLMAGQQLEGFSKTPSTLVDRLECLTNRELHVFRLIGQGRSTKQIAQLLSLSSKTIGTHRTNMMGKLGLANASQLLQRAIKYNEEQSLLEPVGTQHGWTEPSTTQLVDGTLLAREPLPFARLAGRS